MPCSSSRSGCSATPSACWSSSRAGWSSAHRLRPTTARFVSAGKPDMAILRRRYWPGRSSATTRPDTGTTCRYPFPTTCCSRAAPLTPLVATVLRGAASHADGHIRRVDSSHRRLRVTDATPRSFRILGSRNRSQRFGDQRQRPGVALPLVLVIVVEDHMHARCGDRADPLRQAGQLFLGVIVVEALRRRREPFLVPGRVVAPVQANDREFGIGHLPYLRNGVGHALRLVDDDVDQAASALEVERRFFVLAFEPRAIAELDRQAESFQLTLALFDVLQIARVIRDPWR